MTKASRRDLGWTLVALQFVLLVVLVLLPRRPALIPWAVLGAALAMLGAVLGIRAGRLLGRGLTPTPVPVPGAGLRTSGAYRRVRHPIYSAVLLMVLGFVVAVGSAWSAAWAGVILLFFWAKSRWEDGLLHAEYGEEWSRWADRTGALVPRWFGTPQRRDG